MPKIRAATVEDEPGSFVGTWVEDAACDCSVAHAGRVDVDDPSTARGAVLRFDGCRDTSVRGETGVARPHGVGPTVGALAWCNDQGWMAAAWARSTDGGATWTTQRLRGLAAGAGSDLTVPIRSLDGTSDVGVDDGVVLALQALDRSADASPRDPTPPVGRIVLLRVERG